MRKKRCLAFFSFFLGGMLFTGNALPATATGDPLIGPRDTLQIHVFNEPRMSMQVVVSASGEFSFPLLKRVKAAGKTLDELGLYMEKQLREGRFLIDPSVNVQFVEQKYYTVTLSGNVKTPGNVPIYPGMRLREALTRQGGILDTQAGQYIHIQGQQGRQLIISRDKFERGTSDEMRELNVELMPGDEIIVPNADEFYVLGAVVNPNRYKMNRTITLGDALGMAGGRAENGGSTLFWHHNKKGQEEVLITFTYKQYQENVKIRSAKINPGDTLFVSQNDYVFVGGKVKAPKMVPWQPGLTIASAILAAGGRDFSASKSILMIRQDKHGNQVKKHYNISDIKNRKIKDPILNPGDIIYVSANPIINIPYTVRRINPFSFTLQLFEESILN